MASQNPTDSFRPVAVERIEDRLLFAADCARIFTDSDYEVVAQSLADADPLNGISVREQYGFDGYGQTVVVIDSGVAYDHYAGRRIRQGLSSCRWLGFCRKRRQSV
ncbi:MAG: hypothetical protein R3C28_24325 [Pirellulaceae bacterium]